MKIICAAIVAILTLIAGTYLYSAETYRLSGRAGEYSLTITFDKKQPTTGKNRVYIEVIDNSNHPVRNARIQVRYYMPSLPGKRPMMEAITSAKASDTRYQAELILGMKGEWKMDISIDVSGNRTEFSTGFQVK